MLGEGNAAYYVDRLPLGGPDASFATITDFGAGDQIQLATGIEYRTEFTPDGTGFTLVRLGRGGVGQVLRDVIANVSFGDVGSAAARQSGLVKDSGGDATLNPLVATVPQGTFALAAGQSLGAFVTA